MSEKRSVTLIRPEIQWPLAILTGFLAVEGMVFALFVQVAAPLANTLLHHGNLNDQPAIQSIKASWQWLLASGVFMFVLAAAISLKLTHKIAGPVHRIETALNDRLNGRIARPIRLREGDRLDRLAEKVSLLLEKAETIESQSKAKADNSRIS